MFVNFRCFVFTFYHKQVNHRFQQIKGMNLGIEKIGLKNLEVGNLRNLK